MKDVAERAGVSTATVSRFLNDPSQVREERRKRIEKAIGELGYIMHGAARALKSQRTRTVGAIVPTLDNAIFARAIDAFQRRLQENGYTLFVASSNYDPKEELTQLETLVARGVDAILLVGREHEPKLIERLKTSKIPYVHSWTYDPSPDHPCVGFDNREAAGKMAQYLLDIGHRSFGVIAGIIRGNDRAAERLEGIRQVLAQNNAVPDPGHIIECPYEIASGRQAMRDLMASSVPPTAVICGNDILAYGALLECQASGIAVPDRVSVTGFDDLPMSLHIQPPLTTMHVPSVEMGSRAADYLLHRLKQEAYNQEMLLEVRLVVRDTTAPPDPRADRMAFL